MYIKIGVVFLIIVIIRFFYYFQNLVFLLKTNDMIHNGKEIYTRLFHLRTITQKLGLLMDLSVLLNMDTEHYLPEISRSIVALAGETKRRMLESFNPIYWVMIIVFLPSKIVNFFGGKADGVFAKIANFFYWVIDIVLVLFTDEIKELILSLFK